MGSFTSLVLLAVLMLSVPLAPQSTARGEGSVGGARLRGGARQPVRSPGGGGGEANDAPASIDGSTEAGIAVRRDGDVSGAARPLKRRPAEKSGSQQPGLLRRPAEGFVQRANRSRARWQKWPLRDDAPLGASTTLEAILVPMLGGGAPRGHVRASTNSGSKVAEDFVNRLLASSSPKDVVAWLTEPADVNSLVLHLEKMSPLPLVYREGLLTKELLDLMAGGKASVHVYISGSGGGTAAKG